MIAADTNLIVRYLTHDDAAQTTIVERLVGEAEARGEPVFVGHIVLGEVCWTLGTLYGFSKAAIGTALRALLDDRAFLIQDRALVEQALALFRRGPAEFPDYLIGEAAQHHGASETLTFDRRLARTPTFRLAR